MASVCCCGNKAGEELTAAHSDQCGGVQNWRSVVVCVVGTVEGNEAKRCLQLRFNEQVNFGGQRSKATVTLYHSHECATSGTLTRWDVVTHRKPESR